jgi:predicted transcriptional regulator
MSTPTQARTRSENLKQLREAHAATVERTQTLLREQKQTQKEICQTIRDNPETVPNIAAAISMPAYKVLWHLAALKKYGIVVEAGMSGDFVLYKLTKEA